MATPEQQAKNLKTARDIISQQQGVDPANLTYEQRLAYNRSLAAFIAARPDDFSDISLGTSRQILMENPTALEDSSMTVGGFASAAFDEAADINEAINPFSATNRKWILGVAVLGAAIYFLGPRIIEAMKKAPVPLPA